MFSCLILEWEKIFIFSCPNSRLMWSFFRYHENGLPRAWKCLPCRSPCVPPLRQDGPGPPTSTANRPPPPAPSPAHLGNELLILNIFYSINSIKHQFYFMKQCKTQSLIFHKTVWIFWAFFCIFITKAFSCRLCNIAFVSKVLEPIDLIPTEIFPERSKLWGPWTTVKGCSLLCPLLASCWFSWEGILHIHLYSNYSFASNIFSLFSAPSLSFIPLLLLKQCGAGWTRNQRM